VLSDIMMPEMDGIALLKAVKSDPAICHTPIILITARAGEESRIEGIEIGADDYIVKPFSSRELIARAKAQIRMSTERHRITDELERKVEQRTQDLVNANRELESFSYVASHDLQEPLRKIQTFIHLIERNNFDSELSKSYFQKIYQAAQRMGELIQSVLSYSRLAQNGEATQQVDLNRIIDDIRVDFELAIEEKHAVLITENLPVIAANPLQMNQLFSNLISNSLKFSTVQPEIRITGSRQMGQDIPLALPEQADRAYHHICVKDNGIGFEPEFREKIFSLFQRLHRRQEYAGTGIGLSIVKKIIEQHEGFVSAESHPGEGAAFHIWLPVS